MVGRLSTTPASAPTERSDTEQWFHYPRRVAWSEVDPSTNYQFTAALRYVEEAEIAWLAERGVLGLLYPHLPRTFVRVDFRSAAHFRDELTVDLRLGRLGRSSIEFEFRLRHGDRLCAEGTLGTALIGADGRPVQLPAVVRHG